MLRIDASSTSMNWTRLSSIRIATPRRVWRDDAAAAGSVETTGEGDALMDEPLFQHAVIFRREDTRRPGDVTSPVEIGRPLLYIRPNAQAGRGPGGGRTSRQEDAHEHRTTCPHSRPPPDRGREGPAPPRLRAGAVPRDGRVPELRDLVHDHLDPRGVPDLVLHRVRE